MKKVFFACVLALAGALAFGQKSWTHSAGLSFNPSYYSMNVKGDGCKNAFVPQFSARYYGEAQNGFCLAGTLNMGWTVSRDFKLESENQVSAGFAMGLSFGAGYAFHFKERWTLAALGSLSLDWMRVRHKKTISARLSYGTQTSSWTQNDSLFLFGIGAEALGIYKLTDHVSLWGSLALRFFDAGSLKRSGDNQGRSYKDSFEIRGNVSFTPSFGAAWTF